MRIALFTEIYLNDINGVVTHVRSLAHGLREMGHEVLIVTADARTKRHYLKDGVLHCPAISIKRIYGYGAALPISSKRLLFIRRFRPDIIHIHTEMSIGLSGIAAAKLLRKPLVYTLHTMYDDYVYYISPRRLIRATTYLSHKYLKLVANRSNALIGPSRKSEAFFDMIGVRKPVSVIRNPVELDLFTAESADAEEEALFRSKMGISASAMIACFVGRIGKEKNLHTLLDYWAQSVGKDEGFHLLIVGTGPALEALGEQARTLGIAERVTFAGRIEHGALPFYYKICKAYITASLTEVYSISMLEAMASGLPVLQLKDELNSDQIQEGKNGFFYKTDTEMKRLLYMVRDMDETAYLRLRNDTVHSARANGAVDVAKHVLGVYGQITPKRHRFGRNKSADMQ